MSGYYWIIWTVQQNSDFFWACSLELVIKGNWVELRVDVTVFQVHQKDLWKEHETICARDDQPCMRIIDKCVIFHMCLFNE